MNDVRRGERYRWVHDRSRAGVRARYRLKRIVVETATRYQEVGIYDLHACGRTLFLDGVLQSAERDERRYHEMLVHPAMLAHPGPRRVLIAGGGEGATLREVLRHNTVERAVMAELDEDLVRLCLRHMPGWSAGAFEDARARLRFGDARRLIERSVGRFDVCICDLTEPTERGASTRLFTLEFFRAVRRCLRGRGIVVTQAGALVEAVRMYRTVRATLGRVFKHVSGYWARIPSFREPWGFLAASDGFDLRAMGKGEVAGRLAERGVGRLRYYGPGRVEGMFRLPQGAGRSARRASSDSRPYAVSRD